MPWTDTSRVAERGGELVGFVGAEIDDSLSRVWLHGPLAEDTDWDATAEALLATLLSEVSRTAAKDQELAVDVQNERAARLATRLGFVAGSVHYILTLDRAGIGSLPTTPPAVPIDERHEQAFVVLHESLFPGTYYSGPQLLEQAAQGKALVLGRIHIGRLVGYAAGRIDEGGNAYIDFVGVAADHRRNGHGAALVVALTRALAAQSPIDEVRLTVSSENRGALALYDALGFARASGVVAYRRPAEPAG
jgi:GNAT superfamily N-acetyltransferase